MTNEQARRLADLLNQLPGANGMFHPIHMNDRFWEISACRFIPDERLRVEVAPFNVDELPDEVLSRAKNAIAIKAEKKGGM